MTYRYPTEAEAIAAWNQRATPADMVAVPREATEKMIEAALTTNTRFGKRAMASIYRAMLSAAPVSAPARDDMREALGRVFDAGWYGMASDLSYTEQKEGAIDAALRDTAK